MNKNEKRQLQRKCLMSLWTYNYIAHDLLLNKLKVWDKSLAI